MKYLLLVFLLITGNSHAQSNIDQTSKAATFIKVWGFLKYYHPEVAKGKLDWDSVFMTKAKTLYSLDTKESINTFYSDWINSLGNVPSCKGCKQKPDVDKNFDNGWLSDETYFSPAVIKQLKWIEANRNTGDNYYVKLKKPLLIPDFSNEKTYEGAVFPSAEMRLLALGRYWNVIQYYFPYKYAIGRDWKTVLPEFIPKFYQPADTMAYHLALKELVATINDSHANISTPYLNRWIGGRWVPFMFTIIDNKAVVSSFFNDTLAKANDIQLGDAIVSINNKPVADIIKEKWKYSSGSNDAVKIRGMSYMLFNGHTDSVHIRYERDGVLQEKNIGRYIYSDLHYTFRNGGPDSFRILPGNIGLVNLGWLQLARVKEVMQSFANTKAIIFDVRGYPNGVLYTLAEYLNPQSTPFVKFMKADEDLPGDFQYTTTTSCGSRNKKYYKGKVIMLFNEYSQSHAEFTLMALKTAPNSIAIGSQTSGADGNVCYLQLPGNYKTLFTSIGVYYPDGIETQRIGIVPDIVIKPTIAGLKAGKDELLERAITEANK